MPVEPGPTKAAVTIYPPFTEQDFIQIGFDKKIVFLSPDLSVEEVKILPWWLNAIAITPQLSIELIKAISKNFGMFIIYPEVSVEQVKAIHDRTHTVLFMNGANIYLIQHLPNCTQLIYCVSSNKKLHAYINNNIVDKLVTEIPIYVFRITIADDVSRERFVQIVRYFKSRSQRPDILYKGFIILKAGEQPEHHEAKKIKPTPGI